MIPRASVLACKEGVDAVGQFRWSEPLTQGEEANVGVVRLGVEPLADGREGFLIASAARGAGESSTVGRPPPLSPWTSCCAASRILKPAPTYRE